MLRKLAFQQFRETGYCYNTESPKITSNLLGINKMSAFSDLSFVTLNLSHFYLLENYLRTNSYSNSLIILEIFLPVNRVRRERAPLPYIC